MKTFKETYPDAKNGDRFEIVGNRCGHYFDTGEIVVFCNYRTSDALMSNLGETTEWYMDAADVKPAVKKPATKTKIKAPKGKVIDTIEQDDDKAVVTFKSIDDRPMSWSEYLVANVVRHKDLPVAADDLYAMYKLRLLRDAWRKGWVPNCVNSILDKWVIHFFQGDIRIANQCFSGSLLSFETKADAMLFLEKFGDIIGTAKPYLGG